MPATITINRKTVDVSESPLHQTLLDFLRESGLTGTKCGCNEGDCGACTLLVLEADGRPPRAINACLALVRSFVGREILTCEGLASKELHPAQKSMAECGGSQCGYCTPGIVCSMAEASARGITDSGDREAIADQLCGNLCRCTGYRPIREAALQTPTTSLTSATASDRPLASNDYHLPNTLEEAFALKRATSDASYLAGATELSVLINKRGLRPSTLISLENIEELRSLKSDESSWSLGAGAPLTDIEAALDGEFPALDQMFRLFGSRQIRHRATLGGNLVTASPIGDSAPVLLALDAMINLHGDSGIRSIPIAEFFKGYRSTVMTPDEILVSIEIPRQQAGVTSFQKVSKRREMDISSVSAALRISYDDNGKINLARLAYGGVAATPMRAKKTEDALMGRTIEEARLSEVLDLLVSEFTPMDDHRASADYRRLLIKELFRKHLADQATEEPPSFGKASFLGTNPNDRGHESAIRHVTGEARYVEDDGLRSGSALRIWPVLSRHARARILKLDSSGIPDDCTFISASDIPGLNNTGPVRHDEPLFAEEEVHYRGQLIGAVVGASLEKCRLAADRIKIDYEPLQPILGIEKAVEAGSFHTEPHVLSRGDADQGLEDSEHLLEGTLDIGGQEHFYLETHAASARPDGEGGILVRSSTQHPSEIQFILAEILGTPRNNIVVEAPRMGGAFGGKETQGNVWAAVCALAATKTDREVMIQLDRDQDMEWSGKRHPFRARYRVGFSSEGILNAASIDLVSDGGWALDLSQPVCDRALFHLDNCYYIPHVAFSGRVAKTNSVSHTAFRGFGGPQGMLVIEEILGQIARKLDLEPELVRSRNFYHGSGPTNTTHYGEAIEGNRLPAIWPKLLATSNYHERRREIDIWNNTHENSKRGLAITPVKFGISFTLKHYNQAGALVLVFADGSVQVNHGGTEMGQGLHTKILGIAMRELGLGAKSIRLMHTRTDKVPNTSATAASSGSDLNGMAVADACRQLRDRLAPLAARILDCEPSDISFRDDQAQSANGSVKFPDLAAAAYRERIQLSAAGFYKTPGLEWDWKTGKGNPFHYFAFGAAVSEVEIDGFTGMHHTRRVDILHDVGDSLNPSIDRGQIEGGFVQAAGWLTNEELKWDDEGKLLTHSASTYAIPAFSDAPIEFKISLLDHATQDQTIHGSKAVGEPPFMLALSLREALRDALHAFGAAPDSKDFPSPLTGERMKILIGELS